MLLLNLKKNVLKLVITFVILNNFDIYLTCFSSSTSSILARRMIHPATFRRTSRRAIRQWGTQNHRVSPVAVLAALHQTTIINPVAPIFADNLNRINSLFQHIPLSNITYQSQNLYNSRIHRQVLLQRTQQGVRFVQVADSR